MFRQPRHLASVRVERTPDDPDNEPTQMADFDYPGGGSYNEPLGYSQYREPTGEQPSWSQEVAAPEPPPTPWYLRPLALVGLGVLTALLITALVWGMVRLANQSDQHSTTTTTTPVPSTTAAPSEEPTGEPSTPSPEPAVPGTADENPPASATEPTTEAPTSTATSTPAPTSTTTSAPATTTTTAPATTSAPATTTATTTKAAPTRPSEIVIPLPPGWVNRP